MSDPSASPPTNKTYHEANCHCGAIKYKVFLPDPLSTLGVYNCNCSICLKNGYLNVHCKRADVVFERGEELAKGYVFGEKKWVHRFCPECGSSLWIDPAGEGESEYGDLRPVNVRMFKDVDVDKLKLIKFDGASKLEPRYEV